MEKKDKMKDYSLMTDDEKAKALAEAIGQIEKSFGKGAIIKGDQTNVTHVEVIPTGCLSLDMALGIGGLPRGRIVEIFGPESSGKTTLSLHAIAEAQKDGGVVAFIDAEHALDPIYATNLGINLSELYISQPDNGEQALDIAESLVRSGGVDLIVVDSVAALTPRAEIEGDMGDSHMGLQARLMSQALRKLAGVCNKTKTCIIFINQLREKMGGYTGGYGGPIEVTPGGKALKFYSSVRMDVRRGESIKNAGDQIGNRTRVKIVKNKLAPPFRVVEFDIIYGKGISKESIIIDMAVEAGIVKKAGSWFSYNDERLGQGKESVKALFDSKPELYSEIEQKIRASAVKTPVVSDSDDEKDDSED